MELQAQQKRNDKTAPDRVPGTAEQNGLDTPISTSESTIEAERRANARVTVVSSSGSHQLSSDDGSRRGGLFTQKLLVDLKSGKNFSEAVVELTKTDINPAPHVKQIPVLTGDKISPEVLSEHISGQGIMIHVTGQVKKGEAPGRFLNDKKELSDYFKERNFEVFSTETFGEFRGALSEAVKLQDPSKNSSLMIYFSGHAVMMAPIREGGLASVTRPQVANNPLSEGIFIFKGHENRGGFESAEFVHEAQIMNEVRTVKGAEKFENIIIVFDACNSGSFDANQYLDGEQKPVPSLDENRLSNSLSR